MSSVMQKVIREQLFLTMHARMSWTETEDISVCERRTVIEVTAEILQERRKAEEDSYKSG